MKEGGGGDHIAVGVKLPSGTFQRPISQEDIYIRPPPGMMQANLLLKIFIHSAIMLSFSSSVLQNSHLYFNHTIQCKR